MLHPPAYRRRAKERYSSARKSFQMVSNGAKLLTQVVVAEIRRWRQRRSHLAKTFSRRGSGRSASVPSGAASAASPPAAMPGIGRQLQGRGRSRWRGRPCVRRDRPLRIPISPGKGYFGTPCFHWSQWTTTSLMNGAAATHRLLMAGTKPPELPSGPQPQSECQADSPG